MSVADYSQTAEDHQSMLVLIQQVGNQLKTKTANRLFDRISRLDNVYINSTSQQRVVHLRHKRSYPLENNEWGDFQAHRKVLGLLCIAKCTNENELAELYAKYDDLKQLYSSTLFDSRLIVFGLNKDGTALDNPELLRDSSLDSDSSCTDDSRNSTPTHKPQTTPSTKADRDNSNIIVTDTTVSADDTGKTTSLNFVNSENKANQSPQTRKQRKLKSFPDPLNANALLRNANSVQNPLQQNPAQTPASQQPSTNGSKDKEPSSSRVWFYPSTDELVDLEERLRDFAASLFWVLESKRLDRSLERQDKLMLLMTPFEKKDFVGIDTDSRTYKKRCQGRLRKHLADLCLLAGLPAEALLHYQTALDVLRSANDWLWLAAAYEGLCSASIVIMYPQKIDKPALSRNFSFSVKRGSSAIQDAKLRTGSLGRGINGLDLADAKSRNCLLPDDIIAKYKEAILQYSKFKNAGIIETEASIKACRFLIMQSKFLDASEFLQNVVYINLQLSEEEKIQRYSTLSLLYGQIGMHRKAAFFKRVAAMQCVAPQNPKPGWLQCYQLLIQALDGYKLSLDVKDFPPDHMHGWPIVQLRVLHEIIYSARRMGNPAIAVRHLTLLLHTMFEHLTVAERQEMAGVLESYTGKCEGTTQTLALDNGVILPPVPFTKFPTVRTFKLQNPPPHMRPTKLKGKSDSTLKVKDSPFIYSPLTNMAVSTEQEDLSKIEFQWVESDVCEVALQVYNPLPFELRVSNMGLMTEGVDFESYPASLSLPAESGPFPVKIMGTPKESGRLSVLGYTTHVLGVRNHCRLRDIYHIPVNRYDIDVVPPLPQLHVVTSLPKAASFSNMADSASVVTSATISLYAGESCDCEVTLTNTGKQPIELVDISLDSKVLPDLLDKVLVWKEENLRSQLPLAPQAQASFTVYLYGASDFLPMDQTDLPFSPRTKANRWFGGEIGDSASIDGTDAVIVEALVKLQYSGGPGLVEGHCRQCSIAMTIEIQPSVVFTAWDILPDACSQFCHLVLDMENSTNHQMELSFNENEEEVLESKQCKRLAARLKRCRFQDFSDVSLTDSHMASSLGASASYIHDMYSQHIATFVDVRWHMASSGSKGKALVDRLRWTKEQVAHFQPASLLWNVDVNGESHNLSSPMPSLPAHHPVTVKAHLSNHSGGEVHNIHISILCYQDLTNGLREFDQQQECVSMGPCHSFISLIGVDETVCHEVGFVFLSPGYYKLEIKAQAEMPAQPDQSSTVLQNESEVEWLHSPPVALHIIDDSDGQ